MQELFAKNASIPNNMPWQIKAIGLVGVPSAIAIYLVLSLDQGIRADNKALRENLVMHAQQTQFLSEQNSKLVISIDSLKRSIDRICANTSRNFTERNECFR